MRKALALRHEHRKSGRPMKPPLRATLLAFTLGAAAACSDTVSGSAGTAPDSATPADQSAPDAITADASVSPDGTVISPDGAVTPDGAVISPDVVADGPAIDGAATSLLGRWRVVAWDYTNATGTTIQLTDRDTTITPPGGTPTPLRTNGVFTVRPTRLSWSFATLASEHFYTVTPMTADAADYSGTGTSAPGLTDDASGTFTVAGGMPVLRFERNADGTISMSSMEGGERSRVTMARAPSSPVQTNLNTVGVAQLRDVTASRPMRHPRFALLWDRPSSAPVETNGAALTFRNGYATYFVVQSGAPPAEVQGRAYGVATALAYPFVYDDLNDNGSFDAATPTTTGDESRGFGPLVIVWRGDGTPTASFESSPFVDTQPGWQVAHLHLDYGTGSYTVTPFDTTVPVNPDVPVANDVLRGPVPRLVR